MEGDRELRRAGWRLIARRAAARSAGGSLLGVVRRASSGRSPRSPSRSSRRPRSTTGIIPGDGGAIVQYSVLIALFGVVQAVGTGLRRYAAFRLSLPGRDRPPRPAVRAPPAPALRVPRRGADRPAHVAREHRHPSRSTRCCVIVPLTLASIFILIGVIAVMVSKSAAARVARARRAAAPATSRRTRFSHRIGPVTFELQRKLGDLSGVVEESVAGVRAVKGFGAEQLQAQRLDAEADAVLERALVGREAAGRLPPARRLPSRARAGGHPLVRRPSRARRQPPDRRPRRVQLLHPHVDLADAHGGPARRAGVARVGRGGAHPRGALAPTPRDRRPGARRRASRPRAAASCGSRACDFAYGDGVAGARRARPRAAPRRGGRVVGSDRERQDDHRAARPALLRRRRRAGCSSTASTCASSTLHDLRQRGRHRVRGHVPVLRHASARTSRSRIPTRRWTLGAPRRAARGRGRLHRRAARGLRDGHRRARLLAVGRPASAHRHRPRGAGRSRGC